MVGLPSADSGGGPYGNEARRAAAVPARAALRFAAVSAKRVPLACSTMGIGQERKQYVKDMLFFLLLCDYCSSIKVR